MERWQDMFRPSPAEDGIATLQLEQYVRGCSCLFYSPTWYIDPAWTRLVPRWCWRSSCQACLTKRMKLEASAVDAKGTVDEMDFADPWMGATPTGGGG